MVSLNLTNSQSSSGCQMTLRKNSYPLFPPLLSFLGSLTYWTFSTSQLHCKTLLLLAMLSKARIKQFGFSSILHCGNHTSMKYCAFQYLGYSETTGDWAKSCHSLISVYRVRANWIDVCCSINLDFFPYMKQFRGNKTNTSSPYRLSLSVFFFSFHTFARALWLPWSWQNYQLKWRININILPGIELLVNKS